MSVGTTIPRHPLGLPPGTVRAVLVFQIVAQFWLLISLPKEKLLPVPLYLYALLSLVLVFFTTSGRHQNAEPEETGLLGSPKWLYGLFLSAVTAGLLAWQLSRPVPDGGKTLYDYLKPVESQLAWWPALVLCLVTGYGFGRLLRVGPWASSMIFQDLLAWLSLLGMLGLLIEAFVQTLIYPNLHDVVPNAHAWETGLTALIAVYFGARS